MRWQIAVSGSVIVLMGLVCCPFVSATHGEEIRAKGHAEAATSASRAAERNRLWQEARAHSQAGDYAAAIAAAEKTLQVEIWLFGECDDRVAYTHGWIGDQQFTSKNYQNAASSYDKRAEILTTLAGKMATS